MSRKWYPVIDFSTCIECGACIDKCSHGVYQTGTQKPNVINPDGCIDGCHGCQKLCPTGSIDYVGDVDQSTPCNCSCTCQ